MPDRTELISEMALRMLEEVDMEIVFGIAFDTMAANLTALTDEQLKEQITTFGWEDLLDDE